MMILLEDDSETLDEVMVVAYGTAKKSTFTGSASLLKSEKNRGLVLLHRQLQPY